MNLFSIFCRHLDKDKTAALTELPIIRTPARLPQSGESWILLENFGDPFPPLVWVRVREIKDGWVRYDYYSNNRTCGAISLLSDYRKSISDFLQLYTFYKSGE